MKGDRILIVFAVAIFIVGGIVGFALRQWTVPAPPPPPVAVQHNETHELTNAEKAKVYATGFDAGRASVRPVVRTVTVAGATHTEVVYDSTALAAALEAYSVIDSLLGVINAEDVVAHSVMDVPDHRLELIYAIRARSFNGTTITCTRPDSVRRVEVERAETWWDRWSLGATLGVGPVYVPGEGLRLGAGVLVGIQYEF